MGLQKQISEVKLRSKIYVIILSKKGMKTLNKTLLAVKQTSKSSTISYSFQVFAIFNTLAYGLGAYVLHNDYKATPPELQW